MRISFIQGRLGSHRFHSMLVHFPTALYPFSFVMDAIGFYLNAPAFSFSGYYGLAGALGISLIAIVYGCSDFLQLKGGTVAWRKAGLHALLNIIWLFAFSSLFMFRLKYPDANIGWTYLTIYAFMLAGLFYSNYLGADLVIKHKVGIEP